MSKIMFSSLDSDLIGCLNKWFHEINNLIIYYNNIYNFVLNNKA